MPGEFTSPEQRKIWGARRDWSPTIICESAGTQDVDALTMKQLYLKHLM